MELAQSLQTLFGYGSFRPHQERIIRLALDGKDTLGVLPTGAGKSLCYQLPAMLLPRPTLVLSPLIALMKDQLDGLPPAVYDRATLINSQVDLREQERRLQLLRTGRYKLIYAAPERLRQESFLNAARRVGLSLAVVDEAHCVSVWGHDFRPDYLFIRRALDMLSEPGRAPRLLALTATATAEMQSEIAHQLGRPLELVVAPTFRPNLRMEVYRCASADEKARQLGALLREEGGSAIVYANSRERCEKLAELLNRIRVSAAHYHAGLTREMRDLTQNRFMLGEVRVMVATVAFGMGVDKQNVRMVAHFNLPESLEAYTQEAGRAGRDGKPARCILLYAPGDKANLARWLRVEELKLEVVRDVYRALKTRIPGGQGAIAPGILQRDLAAAGHEAAAEDARMRVAVSVLERVGLAERGCDSGRDMTIRLCPPPPGARAEIETLLAARHAHAERRMEEMVLYAEGPDCRHAAISRHFGQEMEPCGDACDRCLGAASSEAPPAETKAWRPKAVRERGPAAEEPDMTASEDDRYEQLRAWRRVTAQELAMPPYVVFHDTALRAIARANPATLRELAAVPGLGPRKMEQWGESLIALLHPRA